MNVDVKMLLHLFSREPVLKSNRLVLYLRLCLFGAAWIHLLIAAIIILPVDMTVDEDPRVRAYQRLKWRFITAWFNFINLAYFPLCIYCDWKEMKGEENQEIVSKLRRIRDVVFTSILFPTIAWADMTFWQLYFYDPALISPTRLFDYMPSWGQHSLHTVSLVVAVFDLLLTPRRKPPNLIPRLKLLTVFYLIYFVALFERYLQGEAVYQILEIISGFSAVSLVILFYLEELLFYFIQWMVIDLMWKTQIPQKSFKNN